MARPRGRILRRIWRRWSKKDRPKREPSEQPPFTYEHLAEGCIRLLLPDPTGPPDGHSWVLHDVHLDEPAPVFDALSYAWGPQAETFAITLNGCSAHVHRNLYNALPYLAQRQAQGDLRPIWIDAICINQQDSKEKMRQIESMHKIYRQAMLVWVWLGVATEGDQAIARFSDLAHQATQLLDNSSLTEQQKQSALGFEHLDPYVWSVSKHVLTNEWYTRLWVLQEVVLAQDVVFLYSNHTMPVVHVESVALCSMFSDHVRGVTDFYEYIRLAAAYRLFHTRELYRKKNAQTLLSSMLYISVYTSQYFHCTEPQDRVLGLLGMLDEQGAAIKEALRDTGSTVHDEEDFFLVVLYTSFSRLLLTQNSSSSSIWWEYLALASKRRTLEKLPSWVPDLHHLHLDQRNLPHRSLAEIESHGRPLYLASPTAVGTARAGPAQDQLLLQAKIIDAVMSVYAESPSVPFTTDYAKILSSGVRVAAWEKSVAAAVLDTQPEEHGEGLGKDSSGRNIHLETYWRTLLGNKTDYKDGELSSEDYHRFRERSEYLGHVCEKYHVFDE
jgi:hypothetical protein